MPLPGGGGGSQVSDGGGAKGSKGSFRLWEKACTQSGLQLVYCYRKSTQTTEKEFHQKQLATLSLRQYTLIKMRHPEIWGSH